MKNKQKFLTKAATFSSVKLVLCLCAVLLVLSGCAGKGRGGYDDVARLDEEEIAPLPFPPADDGIPLTRDELIAMSYNSDFIKRLSDKDELEVMLHFKYFTHRARGHFERYLLRAERYLPYVEKIFREKGIPADIAYLAIVESGFNPNAVSTAGATGMWQFMLGTGDVYGLKRNWWIDERRDPYKATHAAADYLLKLYGDFGDWYLALAAYNAGEGKISRAMSGTGAGDFFELCERNDMLDGKAKLKPETRKYVPKFIAVTRIMHNLKRLGFKEVNRTFWQEPAEVVVAGGTDLRGLAAASGLSWNEFIEYNPAPQRQATAPGSSVSVYLPQTSVAAASAFLASPQSRSFAGWRQYTVKKGDTIKKISQRTGVPSSVILEANQIKGSKLKAGRTILVPASLQRNTETATASSGQSASKSSSYHMVKEGETYYSISRKYDTSVDTLCKVNNTSSGAPLKIGQKVYLPGKSKSPAAAVASSKQKAGNSKQQAASKKIAVASTGKGKKYTVQEGDSLWGIARKHGVNPVELMQWNNLSKESVLKPGDKVTIQGN